MKVINDFVESILIFLVCLASSFTIYMIHDSHFIPYFDKGFLLELSVLFTVLTAVVAGYEWHLLKKNH